MKTPKSKVAPRPTNVPAALDALGIDYRIKGDEAQALCPNPNHEDSKPSWSVNLKTGQHNCFACGFGGPFIRLVKVARGLKDPEAELWIKTQRASHPVYYVDDEVTEKKKSFNQIDFLMLPWPPEWALKERGVSLAACQRFDIRWIPSKEMWVFPIKDPDSGDILGWQEKNKRLFINRPYDVNKGQAVFGIDALPNTTGELVVVESPVDAAIMWDAGIQAVSTFGTGFTMTQIDIILESCDTLVFAMDNDHAGHVKVAQFIASYRHLARKCKVFSYNGEILRPGSERWYIHEEGDGRDPGDLTPSELRDGVRWATPAIKTRFKGAWVNGKRPKG